MRALQLRITVEIAVKWNRDKFMQKYVFTFRLRSVVDSKRNQYK